MSGLRTTVDALAGRRLQRFVVGHHRRRLERLGQGVALAPSAGGWASTRPPVAGNALDVLVDGADALPQIARAIEAARSSVWLAGWFFTPEFRLDHEDPRTLRELLARSGAASRRPPPRVGRCAAASISSAPKRGRRGQARPGRRHRRSRRARLARAALHCHHEKLVIVDGEIAFVGGIDLTSTAATRSTRPSIRARGSLGWHDAAARIARARRSPTSPSTSGFAGGGDRGAVAVRPTPPAAGDVEAAGRRARCPEYDLRAACRAASSRFSSRTCRALRSARAARLSREPVPLVAGDRRRARGQAAQTRRRRLPARSSFSRRSRTTAMTTRADSSADCAEADDGNDRLLACTLYRSAAREARPRLRAREDRRSSTTGGSRSAPRTSTSTRCSTTPR